MKTLDEGKQFYTVTEFAKALGYSRYRIYQLIEDGRIRSEMFGRMRAISKSEMVKWLQLIEVNGKYKLFPRVERKRK